MAVWYFCGFWLSVFALFDRQRSNDVGKSIRIRIGRRVALFSALRPFGRPLTLCLPKCVEENDVKPVSEE